VTGKLEREVIIGGRQPPPWYTHLLPIAKFLVEERGHIPLERPERYGFRQTGGGLQCQLARRITDEDWAAINERFELPMNIQFFHGLIRDNDNRIDFMGFDEIQGDEGLIPIEVWEAQQRR